MSFDSPWLNADELRIGLGCMRLSTAVDQEDARGLEVLRTALSAGITVFDSAHAYTPPGGELGHNERLIALAAGTHPARSKLRVVTKGGMRRDGPAWIPDGRA